MTEHDHWPWPADLRQMWSYVRDEKGRQVSVRNEALWRELELSRTVGEVAAARAWGEALRQDGWALAPTYSHEPLQHAFTATREGFKVLGLCRPGLPGKQLPHGSINMWCDRRMSVSPLPLIYPGWEAIRALTRTCPQCKAVDVATERVAFANRCCANCAPALRQRLEHPGWCD